MRILILGGTLFLGYHLVEAALRNGHEVTIFTRGKSEPNVFPEVERLVGDRDGNLQALEGRRWDAIIDTSGYVPRVVRDSVILLRDATDHYTFISSISVYQDFTLPQMDETAPVAQLDDELSENVAEWYGPLKARCEQIVEEIMPNKALIIRPGLIVGPRDPSDRFTYWPVRIDQGGKVLAPGNPDTLIQFIDVRDLANWIITMVEVKQTGVYQATGPDQLLTMKDLLETCIQTSQSNAELIWIEDTYLVEQGVGAWMEMPLWIPATEDHADMAYFQQVSNRKAVEVGLAFRPLSETIQDTVEWDKARDISMKRKAGLDAGKERELLHKYLEID